MAAAAAVAVIVHSPTETSAWMPAAPPAPRPTRGAASSVSPLRRGGWSAPGAWASRTGVVASTADAAPGDAAEPEPVDSETDRLMLAAAKLRLEAEKQQLELEKERLTQQLAAIKRTDATIEKMSLDEADYGGLLAKYSRSVDLKLFQRIDELVGQELDDGRAKTLRGLSEGLLVAIEVSRSAPTRARGSTRLRGAHDARPPPSLRSPPSLSPRPCALCSRRRFPEFRAPVENG